jgi:SpoVK/Ycf46/Vps4 family AAA+-type ATPase
MSLDDEFREDVKYTDDEIKMRLGKYGAVYLPADIKESVEDIIGNEDIKNRLEDFFKALKKYKKIIKKLKNSKLTPNLTVLLYGPPGTGKTSLTRAFSKKYKIPICVVESDRLVSPLLGDTIRNIRNVVELAADIATKNGSFVLFFDEIDAVGSERSNIHEVGEIKRAVISFLQVIDKVNYDAIPLAIFGATNHQKQLDSAIWRRFTFHLKFDFPDYNLRKLIIESFVNKMKKAQIGVDDSIISGLNEELKLFQSISNELKKKIGRHITEFDGNMFRDEIEKKGKNGLLQLTIGYSGSDIERGTRVALFKTFNTELLTYDIFYKSLKLVGGTAIHVGRQDFLSSSQPDITSTKDPGSDFSMPPEI